jgi:hypothetical protein
MDKVKTWLAAPGRIRMLTVLYILAVVGLKAAGLDSLVSYLGFAAPLLPTDSPVSPVDATAALLGAVAVVKAFAQWFKAPAAPPKA